MWGQRQTKFIEATYLHAVTNVQILCYPQISRCWSHTHTKWWRQFLLFGWEKYYKPFKVRPSLVPSQHVAIIGTARENGEIFQVHDWTMTVFRISYWTNCGKLHCRCEWRETVTLIIFVCWKLRKGAIMSSALRRLTGFMGLNVLMWHQARQDGLWSCFRMCNWKNI